MNTYSLPGLTVSIGTPQVVTEGVGHLWFPRIFQFPSGEILVKHSIAADSSNLLLTGAGIHLSEDGGETWPVHYDVSEGAEVMTPLPDGSLGGVVFRTYGDPGGSKRDVVGHYVKYENGGRRYVFEPWTVTIRGLPRDLEVNPIHGQHGKSWRPLFVLHGDVVPIETGVLTTAYLKFDGDAKYSTVAIASGDHGRNWEFLSVIASPDEDENAPEGPCEPSMTRLADGDLMCVMRSGGGNDRLLWRQYSSNDGRTWTDVERLPASSVDPTVRCLTNDVIVLATGRPGVHLWFAVDSRATEWSCLDLVEHHNKALPGDEHRIVPVTSNVRSERHAQDQTTAYTSMIEISPNHLLLVYDRTPFGWQGVPVDSAERGRVYVVPIEVERV